MHKADSRRPGCLSSPSGPRRGIVSKVVALGSAAIILAACGSGPTAPSASGPIKIGVVTSLSGALASLGSFNKNGVDLAVQQINGGGGLNGRKIEVSYEDDQSLPAQAVIAFNKFASEHVAAVLGPVSSDSALAIKGGPFRSNNNIPWVALAAADEIVEPVQPYAFMDAARSSVVAQRLVDYFKSQGLTRMGVWYASDQAFANTGYNATKQLAQQAGITFVDDEPFSSSATTDFSTLFAKLHSSGAQGLLVWVSGGPAVQITKAAYNGGFHLPLFFSHAQATPLYWGAKATGQASEGAYVVTQLGPIVSYLSDSLALKKVGTDMIAAYKLANGGQEPPKFAFDGYIGMELIADAIKRKGASGAEIRAGLESVNLLTPQGLYKMSPTDHSGVTLPYVQIVQIRNNQPVPPQYTLDQLKKLTN